MGKESKRVVLDTNIFISAILFSGKVSMIMDFWKTSAIKPVITKEILNEIIKTLAYPKFHLTEEEIYHIVQEEILPFVEIVKVKKDKIVKGVCKDPEDDKFITCATSAGVDLIISGDPDLLNIKEYKGIKIIKASKFIKQKQSLISSVTF